MADIENRLYSGAEKNVVLFVTTSTSFFVPFMLSAVSIAIPTIGREFALNAIWLSWISTSFILSSTIFLIPFGKLADRHGRKKIFTYGIIIFTLASIMSGFSNSAAMFISFRVLQGIGGSMFFVTGTAILASVFPATERGKALGISVAAVYLGLSIGPFLGGLLTQGLGWRSIFLVIVPLGFIIIAVILWKLKSEWAEGKTGKFDLPGSIMYGLAITALMCGFSLLPGLSGVWTILAGVAGILLFVWWESRTEDAVLQIGLLRNNTGFLFSNLAMLINHSSTFSAVFLISLYLQYVKGLSALSAGLVMISMPAVQVIFSPMAGRLSDRIEPRILASLGMGLCTISLILFIFLDQGTQLGFLVVSLIIMGLGTALFSSPNTNAIMSSVDRKFYGVASATLATMRQVGNVLSMGIVMLMFALFIGRVEITPEYYPAFVRSLRVVFSISAVLGLGGVLSSLARSKTT